jgi:hypothetical protein
MRRDSIAANVTNRTTVFAEIIENTLPDGQEVYHELSLSMDALREHVVNLLNGKGAHLDFDEAIADFPPDLRGKHIAPTQHTAWQLLEHMRIAQWDILEFSRDPKHVSPKWPEGYWPKDGQPPDAHAWDQSITIFKRDLASMRGLIEDPRQDLFAKIPHGDGQTLLREALVLSDHNAYHLGQLVFLRKLLES